MYVLPTLEEMHSFLVALFKVLLPDRTVARLSFNWKFLRTVAAGVTDNHSHISATRADMMPDTAESDMLDRWGNLTGVPRKASTPSRKDNALRVVGVPTSAVPLSAQLTHDASGLRFMINEAAVIPGGGSVDVDIVAVDTGSTTRLNVGETLTFTSPPAGLEETAELVLDLDEDGEDVESDGAYRLRILSRFDSPPLGGAQEDYRQWALRTTGIAAAYVYPNRGGDGSVDVAALHLGSGEARILTAGERDALQEDLDELRPVSVRAMRVLDVFAEPVDVEAAVITTGEKQYLFDWDDATPLVVLTWDGVTRTLTFTTTRPETMQPGHRITIKPVAGGGTGEQYIIESLSGTSAVVLEEEPDTEPVATDTVYSGGPLVDTVRAALLSHLNNLGTANPDAHRYGAWEGNLRPAAIIRVASLVPGVLDVASTIPAATVEATDPGYPDDDTIGLLVPGRVLVRRAHP
jgi:phage-related baseplate assembly protein